MTNSKKLKPKFWEFKKLPLPLVVIDGLSAAELLLLSQSEKTLCYIQKI